MKNKIGSTIKISHVIIQIFRIYAFFLLLINGNVFSKGGGPVEMFLTAVKEVIFI